MNLIPKLLCLLLFANTVFAQSKGKLLDNETKMPIPFVNMQVLGSKMGYTSDHNGNYLIQGPPNQTIVLSAIGYETKRLEASLIKGDIFLKPIAYKIPEVNISNEDKTLEIGRVKKQVFSYHYGTSDGLAHMIARYFQYEEKYKETPLLKSIEVLTDSDVENAQFNIRLYQADSLGQPGAPIYNKNILVHPEKGLHKTKVDIENLYLEFPKEGLFVALEWLQLEQNRYASPYKDSKTKKTVIFYSLEPSFAVETKQNKGVGWTYTGEWKIDKTGLSRILHMEITLRN